MMCASLWAVVTPFLTLRVLTDRNFPAAGLVVGLNVSQLDIFAIGRGIPRLTCPPGLQDREEKLK
jgi:hypothetical protein